MTHDERNIVEILEAVAQGSLSVDALLAVYGGRAWHIPLKRPGTIAERNRAIYQAWNGHNMPELKRTFQLSTRRLYEIIAEQTVLVRLELRGA